MLHGLRRILRVRTLLEDLAALEVEQAAQVLRQIESTIERERSIARESREAALQALSAGTQPSQERRILAEVVGDLARWKAERLAPLAEPASRRLEEKSREFHARRSERRQVETVLETSAAERRRREDRREQRELDDWFNARSVREANLKQTSS